MKTVQIAGGFIVPDDQCIGKWQQETEVLCHDTFLVPMACDNIPVGGIVIDCGAFDGDHSMAYSAKVGPTGTVIAIEPGKLAFKCLKHNAKQFVSEMLCINAAVSSLHGFRASHALNEENAGASIVHASDPLEESKNSIPTITIDGLMKDGDIPDVHFIKIDCEGSEMDILKGAEQTLRKHRPNMLIEINRALLENRGTKDIEIYEFLLSLNYEWQIVQPNVCGGDPMFDILAWKKIPVEHTAR